MSVHENFGESGSVTEFTVDEFEALSTEELLNRSIRKDAKKKHPTSKDLIHRNRQRILECAKLGASKHEAALLVSKDPQNTGSITPQTIVRDMNDIVGPWRELRRVAERAAISSPSQPSSPVAPTEASDANTATRASSPFMDKNYSEGDVL